MGLEIVLVAEEGNLHVDRLFCLIELRPEVVYKCRGSARKVWLST